MKQDIHPKFHHDCKVICACGNTFTTGSVLTEIRVPICSACHPFFTGKKKLVDTEGQVESYERRRKMASQRAKEKAEIKKRSEEQERKAQEPPKTLKDLLEEMEKKE